MNLGPIIDYAKPLFNLDLFRTLVAAAFGTFAGAWISSRAQRKKVVITEFNNVSAAMILSISICNQFLALKRQIVRPTRDNYLQAKRDHQAYVANLLANRSTEPFRLHTDFQTISQINSPTEALERCVFEKISVRGRALVATVDLIGAINGLRASIEYRNNMIDDFRESTQGVPDIMPHLYLGLPLPSGVVDQRFSHNIDALYAQTDQCIFFSRILATELLNYGNRIRRHYRWRFRLRVAELKPAIWTMAEAENLIPPDEDFTDWLRGFIIEPTKLTRFKTWICAQFH